MMNKNFTYGFSLLAAAFFLFGCSELKEEKIPTQADVSIHGEGFAKPSSDNFHAKYIQSKNYDIQQCKQCHGNDFSGGKVNVSCNSCHYKTNGPENCGTCHGNINTNAAPPKGLKGSTLKVGAHQKHVLGGSLGAPVACKECHTVPTKVTDTGHLDVSNGAEMRFDPNSIMYRSNAHYDGNGSCSNTYCHGNMNGGNLNRTMVWSDTTAATKACGTCHGDINGATLKEKAFPKTGHVDALVTSNCSTCHGAVVDASLNIVNPARHINGRIN